MATSSINEELGSIEYVLSDKTGTLTKNKMEMRGFCVGEKVFGGSFVDNQQGQFVFQRNDELIEGKFATPSGGLIEKVLEETDKEETPNFDQELLQMMVGGDRKWGEVLPIAQLMKGDFKLGGLREIKEEDEDEIDEDEIDEDEV